MGFNGEIPLEIIYENLFQRFEKSVDLTDKIIEHIEIIKLLNPEFGEIIVVELSLNIDCMDDAGFKRYLDNYGYSMFFYGEVTKSFKSYIEKMYNQIYEN